MCWQPAASRPSRTIVVVPPFGEELNKSRRMLALQAQALCGAGVASVLPDLFGTGDSDGDFGDATWSCWMEDVRATIRWADKEFGAPVDVLAVRSGALLALQAITELATPVRRIVLWAPTHSGRTFLTQFLRVQLAAASVFGAEAKVGTQALWAKLRGGDTIEVAGYRLSGAIACCMESLNLIDLLVARSPSATLFDISPMSDEPSAATVKLLLHADSTGVSLNCIAVQGDHFWSTAEITIVPELIRRTSVVLGKA